METAAPPPAAPETNDSPADLAAAPPASASDLPTSASPLAVKAATKWGAVKKMTTWQTAKAKVLTAVRVGKMVGPSRGAMEVMMRLEPKNMPQLQRQFLRVVEENCRPGGGLYKKEFVIALLEKIEHDAVDQLSVVMDQLELFDQIDVNGDGECEWGEFQDFCIQMGMAATRKKHQASTHL
jgi:hypothetical protein